MAGQAEAPDYFQRPCTLLIQVRAFGTRYSADFASVTDCVKGIIKIYVAHLKTLHPNEPDPAYDLHDILEFVNSKLADIICLVYDYQTRTYAPFFREWMMEQICVYYAGLMASIDELLSKCEELCNQV